MGRNKIDILIKADDKASRDLDKVSGKVRISGRELAAAAAGIVAAGAAIGGAVYKLVNTTAQWADKIAKTSKQIGVTTEFLSEMEHAAHISGTTIDNVLTGIKRMARAASDASIGLETYKRAFDYLGITVTRADGQLKETEALFMEVAEAMGAVENATKKAALAQEIFGRGGLPLIPLLNEQAEGIKKLREEAQKLGISLSGENAKKYEDFVDATTRLKASLKGLGMSVANELVKPLTHLMDNLAQRNFKEAMLGFLELINISGHPLLKEKPTKPFTLSDFAAQYEPPKLPPTPTRDFGKVITDIEPILRPTGESPYGKMAEDLKLINPEASKMVETFYQLDEVIWTISSQFDGFFSAIISGTQTVEQAFASMMKNIAAQFASAMMKMAITKFFTAIFGMPFGGLFNKGGEWIPAQRGLEVVGGQYGRDTIPAVVSRGEVVVPSRTVERINRFLDDTERHPAGNVQIITPFFTGSKQEAFQAAEYFQRRIDNYEAYLIEGSL